MLFGDIEPGLPLALTNGLTQNLLDISRTHPAHDLALYSRFLDISWPRLGLDPRNSLLFFLSRFRGFFSINRLRIDRRDAQVKFFKKNFRVDETFFSRIKLDSVIRVFLLTTHQIYNFEGFISLRVERSCVGGRIRKKSWRLIFERHDPINLAYPSRQGVELMIGVMVGRIYGGHGEKYYQDRVKPVPKSRPFSGATKADCVVRYH